VAWGKNKTKKNVPQVTGTEGEKGDVKTWPGPGEVDRRRGKREKGTVVTLKKLCNGRERRKESAPNSWRGTRMPRFERYATRRGRGVPPEENSAPAKRNQTRSGLDGMREQCRKK